MGFNTKHAFAANLRNTINNAENSVNDTPVSLMQ